MLTATFLHAPTIGDVTEHKLWNAGILTWDDFARAAPSDLPVTPAQYAVLQATVEASRVSLAAGDYRYFAQHLPLKEQWRCADAFMEQIGFLDIETNGGFAANSITVIGVYDGFDSRLYVQGRDLEQFARDMERYALWVTFYGMGFDIPFLRRRFPSAVFDQLHIDLCPLLRRLGYRGGLKKIETQLGINRVGEVDGLSGRDAVTLWRAWRRAGNQEALDTLLAYNRADIENLSLLLAFAYGKMRAASGYPTPGNPTLGYPAPASLS